MINSFIYEIVKLKNFLVFSLAMFTKTIKNMLLKIIIPNLFDIVLLIVISNVAIYVANSILLLLEIGKLILSSLLFFIFKMN